MATHSRAQYRASADEIGEGLRRITSALAAAGVEPNGGLLGGFDGYGAYYENETFGMHPYCWCEQDDCPWCAPCLCPEDAVTYTLDGAEISGEKYYRIGGYSGPGKTHFDVEKACRWCVPGAFAAPNFWHKPSGTWVTWYKYIGRGMNAHLRAEWAEVLRECLASILSTAAHEPLTPIPPPFGPGRSDER